MGRARLAGLTEHGMTEIDGPAPDLIIMAGRANEAIALWIKKYRNPLVKLIYVGSPWNNLTLFDLVIATPQYQIPVRANVLHINLPLHDIDQNKLAAAKAAMRSTLAELPRPITAVFVGGPSGPYGFSAAAARRLGETASEHAKIRNGSLVIATSARTPEAVKDALFAAISVPFHGDRFGENTSPHLYFSYLEASTDIIVTADSISMIGEAVSMAKPVALFDPEDDVFAMRRSVFWRGRNIGQTLFRLAMKFAPPRWSRDLRIVHEMTNTAGLTYWLGDYAPLKNMPVDSDMLRTVDRIKQLVHKADHD